jgi:WD40 repeat protein
LRNVHWLEPEATSSVASDSKNLMYFERAKDGKMLQKKRRLVSTSLNGLVVEWNLQTKNIKSKYNCQCAIWDSKMLGKFLYVACEDGSIRILKVKKQKIELVKMFVKSTASCLSIDVVQSPKVEKAKKAKKV